MQEDLSGKQQKPSGPAIEPTHDPLVVAAINGHLEVVKQLEELSMLCSPCAAAEAARKNQTAVVQHLAEGSAKVVLQVSAARGVRELDRAAGCLHDVCCECCSGCDQGNFWAGLDKCCNFTRALLGVLGPNKGAQGLLGIGQR